MRKLKLFTLFAAMLFATSMWATDPWGSIDGLQGKNGSLRVWGWSLDPDDGSKTVEVHVYIFSSSTEDDLGKAVKGIPGTYANISRPDLESLGYGTMHGFDRTIDISDLSAGTYYVHIYALNVAGSGTNPRLPYSGNGGYKKAVTISAPYTVSYNANGGSGAPGSQKKAQDINLKLQGQGSLARNGYTTDGWATSSTGNKVYNFGATYSANASTTLFAHWNVVTYTIGYTLNGGSVTGNPTSYNVTTNTFTLKNPQKTGYTFAGWTGSNGSTKQTSVSIAKGSTGNKSYTANWTPINYTITYDLAGGTATNPANYTIETNTFMLVAPTRSGYIFTGWTGSNGNTPQTSVSVAKGSTGDKSYTANWRSEKQTGSWTYVAYKTGRTNTPNNNSQAISYNGFNGKLGSWGNVSFINAGDKGIGCQATGNGRANEKKGIYSIYKNEQTIPSYAKRRLTATLTVSSSCAKYNTTAALYAHTNQTELQAWNVDFTHGMANSTGSSKRITYLVNSTKNGSWQSQSANYTFDFDNSNGSADATKGWYILLTEVICTYTAYDSGVSEKAVFNSSDENFDTWFYYKYVTFDPNGGTGDMAVQTVENSAQLHHNAFSRTGYSFAGWNTQPDGNGTAYDNEAVITATSTNKGPVTLYAQWTVHQYTISFDSNGGSPVASITQNYGTAVSAPANPTRDGYTFAGWDAEIPTTMPAHDVHLVAHWNALNPTPTAIATEFAYCYDCWRDPAYPTISGQCHLFNFGEPGVGNKNSAGPWKLEFVEYYNSSSSLYDFDVSYPASEYGIAESKVEVYRLYQWNESAGEYQHAAYGVLYAYANESNPVEHAAFFEANGYWGCYLTGAKHTNSDDFNITFDEDAKTGFSDLQNVVTPAEPTMLDILAELHSALGDQVWTGYGAETGVISYSRGDDAEEFRASFMGGTYTILLEFSDFISAEKVANGDGSHTYTLEVNLPAQTGLATEILHVTVNSNGEITGITSVHAGAEMTKESDSTISTWAELQAAMNAGGVIKLTQDITAPANAEALVVPADKTVLLELNGHIIDRALTSAVANGSVIINNGVLAVMDETGNGKIMGGNTTGKGGGVYNNGTFTLYAGEITGNHADEMGGGVYNHISNSDTEGFWMTGGLIDGNTAGSYPAIEGEVAFNNLAVVQINATGTTVSVTTAKAHLDVYNYIKPVMPDMSMYAILAELYAALGDDVWTGYGANTGVISYSRGDEQNEFRASFMGGTYTIDIPFGDFTAASKHEDGGNYIYDLTVNLPAQTGMSQETLHVTVNSNGEIEAIHSDIAEIDLHKETNNEITTWAELQAAMTAGGMIKLTQDITAESTDAALEVPANTTVMLDLNGHTIDRALASAIANGNVIVNNGVLAIMDEAGNGKIKGGKTTGNGGGVLNNGIFTLYAGEITGNSAAQGGGVYNNGGAQGFWMTGGLIDNNTATTNPAISGNVIFNNLAVVQVDANGTTVSPATAVAGLSHYSYIQPVMPNMDMYAILAELYAALGNDVWTGYGVHTGVISYAQGDEPNSFKASFMGGTYEIEIPFGDFTSASKAATAEGGAVYTLVVSLPAQTGMLQETLHVTVNSNGEIEAIHSDIAEIDLKKETDNEITTWAELQAAMTAGGMIKLTHDITAESTDAALEVPANTTVMLDLNGHTIDRALASAVANGNVIVNNGVLAIMDETGNGKIKGGNNSGNGGGIVNNGTFTLYAGEITGNSAAQGGGVYNNVANDGALGFWMTGGLIDGNEAASYPAIKGDVTFSNLAVVQINAGGTTVSAATAIAGLAAYSYIQPVMPNMDMFAILAELHNALGNDVWAGYGEATGVISYAQGDEPNSFKATFMGGTYEIEIPFGDFTSASKADNGDGTFTYTLTVNLPAQTGMTQETLHVTTNANGEITAIHSDNAEVDLKKETNGTIATWADLQNALNEGGLIKLTNDIVNGDAPLVIPENTTVVLDLNGHTIDRGMTSAAENGSVIVNNGTLAIVDHSELANGVITGGKTTGNGGGILNNGVLTLYGGTITGNVAALGGGVYNNGGAQGFWMTGGLIDNNTATTNPAISGEVIFNAQAVVQINADGDKVSIAEALANMSTLAYVQPAMPNYDDLQPADPEALKNELLQELWTALGEDVWTGYGTQTGVISYSRGGAEAFHASFMGGNYAFDLPFAAFTAASKAANTDGSYTYTLTCNLPAQTGMGQETLHVTLKNGEITELESENAGVEMQKEEEISGWASLQNAFAQGGVIKLAADVADLNSEGALVVPAGKTVMLELNGHIINRALTSAVADGSVIINNGTLAIMGEGQITGGKTTGNGGGVLNNGIFTLYGGEITGNVAAIGGGVYNNGGEQGFWMTGGLIKGNTASNYPAIGGEVIFNAQAVVQINADGDKVSIAEALANMATLAYVQPAMPNYDDLQPADPEALKNELLQELWTALGEDVWTGYGTQTGVISYSRGGAEAFHASFMGGNYAFDLPFAAFTEASKAANTDGSYTYTLTCNLPAQTGMGQETLHVTLKNGEITELESENAGIEMQKEEGPVTGWAALQAAMTNGGVIKLGENVTAESTDAALTVPAGKTVVLELNGFNINRALTNAVADGSVIVNNGTLAIMGEGQITGGKTTGNGGGILNNGTLTLYGGTITGNHAALGGGVYNNGGEQGFWMTGGLIHGNTATSNPAIGGDVIFNDWAAVQIDADGTQVTIEQALADLATYSYIKPVMPNYEDIPTGETIAANKDPQNDGTFYSTFYDSANNYILPEGVAAYVADLSGSDLVLTRIAGAGDVIPADNAVILKANSQNFTLAISYAIPVSFSANNDLEGVDAVTAVTDIPGLTMDNCYVLSGTNEYGVGFYRINSANLKAHKAFVKYVGAPAGAPRRMRFVFNEEQVATGVENTNADAKAVKVLRNGQLFIIRNGVEYNVNGQKVK